MAEEGKDTVEESVFTKDELIEAHKEFCTTPELMAGALYYVTEPVTIRKATTLLNKFLNKEV